MNDPEIQAWKNRFERERKARKEAENLLEKKSLELWRINQELENTIRDRTNSLSQALHQAQEANKSKDLFIANISHEIRTPINSILGFTNLLLEKDLNEHTREQLEIILNSTKVLYKIINDILDFSNISNKNIHLENIKFKLSYLIDNIYQQNSLIYKDKKINLNILYDERLPNYIIGDQIRIQQILSNLLNNAFKFTQENGIITLEVKLIDIDESHAKIYFCVSDNGIGISKDKFDLIFQPFTQADGSISKKFGGTGLGLTISSNLLSLMNSKIELESEENQGSKFYFSINVPHSNEDTSTTNNTIHSYNENKFVSANLLVAEDNPTNKLLIEALLKKLQYTFDIASNGIEVIELYKKNKYDLILMDINMPDIDGLSATKQIRNFENLNLIKNIPIIALTANAILGDEEKFIKAGMNGYISKPIIFQTLKVTLLKFLPINNINYEPSIIEDNLDLNQYDYSIEKICSDLSISIPIFIKITNQFFSDLDSNLTNLQNSILKEDFQSVYQNAHFLKGPSSSLKMQYAVDTLVEIENFAKNKIIPTNNLAELKKYYIYIQSQIEKLK
jgi:two-component system, sensor histidine kinase